MITKAVITHNESTVIALWAIKNVPLVRNFRRKWPKCSSSPILIWNFCYQYSGKIFYMLLGFQFYLQNAALLKSKK